MYLFYGYKIVDFLIFYLQYRMRGSSLTVEDRDSRSSSQLPISIDLDPLLGGVRYLLYQYI